MICSLSYESKNTAQPNKYRRVINLEVAFGYREMIPRQLKDSTGLSGGTSRNKK